MMISSPKAQVGLRVREMDHIVLRVKDVERALEFYIGVLGLEPYRVDEFHAGKVGFPSVRINDGTIIDLSPKPDQEPVGDGPRNLDHYCLTVEPTNLVEAIRALRQRGVTVLSDEPAKRSGARGTGTSIYIKDWEGNTIELRYY